MNKKVGELNVDLNTVLIGSALLFAWYWWNNHSLNAGGTGQGTDGNSATGKGNSSGNTLDPSGGSGNPSAATNMAVPKLRLGIPGLSSGSSLSSGYTLTDSNGSLEVAAAPSGSYTVIDQTSAPTTVNAVSDGFQVYSFAGTKVYDDNGNLQYTFSDVGFGMTVMSLIPSTNQIRVCYGADFLAGQAGLVNANEVFTI